MQLFSADRANPCISTFLILLVVISAGCGFDGNKESAEKPASPPSIQIASCNLDEVAEELGLRQKMDELLSNRQALLKSEVINVQQQLQDAVKKKIEEAGESPTEEQKKQLARLQLEATQRLGQAQTQATQLLNQHRASLIQQIRTKIKIPVDQVAREKGINMVVTEHPDFLIFTSGAADITSDVISAARKADLGGLDPDKTDGDATDSPAPTTGGDSADPQ
jgi:Skp family chaperone for outer membrane proteins